MHPYPWQTSPERLASNKIDPWTARMEPWVDLG